MNNGSHSKQREEVLEGPRHENDGSDSYNGTSVQGFLFSMSKPSQSVQKYHKSPEKYK